MWEEEEEGGNVGGGGGGMWEEEGGGNVRGEGSVKEAGVLRRRRKVEGCGRRGECEGGQERGSVSMGGVWEEEGRV